MASFGQYEKLLNGKNVNPYNLILKDKFIWEGNEVYRDSLTYSQIKGDSIRFRYLEGNWGNWYALNAIMENAHEADPLFKQWDKTSGINIFSKQVIDWEGSLEPYALETDITGGVLDADFTSIRINGNRISVWDLLEIYNTSGNDGDVIKLSGGNWIVGSPPTSGGQSSGYISELGQVGTGVSPLYDINQDSILRAKTFVAENSYMSINDNGTELEVGFNPGNVPITALSGVLDHSQTSNLDYDNSGHTGFVSTGTIQDITGIKTFTSDPLIENSSPNLYTRTTSSTNTASGLLVRNPTNSLMSGFGHNESTDETYVWSYADPIKFGANNTEYMRLKSTGQLQFNGYTSTTSYPGTVVGLLGFDANGNVLTTASGGGTGDITSVTAGTLLDGGGTSGDVSLYVDLTELQTYGSPYYNDELVFIDNTYGQRKSQISNFDLEDFGSGTALAGEVPIADGSGGVDWGSGGGSADGNNYTTGVTISGTNLITSRSGLSDITTSLYQFRGDITSVTAGNLLDGGAIGGDVTLDVDLYESATNTSFRSLDYWLWLDYTTGESKKTTISDLENYMQNNLDFGGGSSTPGGTDGQIQYNNNGTLGGFGKWTGNTMTVPGLFRVESLTPTINFSETDNNDWNIYGSAGRLLFNSSVSAETDLKLNDDGSVEMNNYGNGNYSGVPAYDLQVTADGEVIETAANNVIEAVEDSIDGFPYTYIILSTEPTIRQHAEVVVEVYDKVNGGFATQVATSTMYYNNNTMYHSEIDITSSYESGPSITISNINAGTEAVLRVYLSNLNSNLKYYYKIKVKYHLLDTEP
jgi:hypothetical protein